MVGRVAGSGREATARWGLRLDDPFEPGGNCSWVAPGTDADGREIVLKVAWRHTEALHEAEGLAALGGHGRGRGARVRAPRRGHHGDAARAVPPWDRAARTPRGRAARRSSPICSGRSGPSTCRPTIRSVRCRSWPTTGWRVPKRVHAADPATTRRRACPRGVGAVPPAVANRARPTCCCSPTCTPATCCPASAARGCSSTPSRTSATRTTTSSQHLLNCNGSLQADPIGLLTEVADLAGLDAERVRQWLFARCVQESLGDGSPWPGLDVVLQRLGEP